MPALAVIASEAAKAVRRQVGPCRVVRPASGGRMLTKGWTQWHVNFQPETWGKAVRELARQARVSGLKRFRRPRAFSAATNIAVAEYRGVCVRVASQYSMSPPIFDRMLYRLDLIGAK